MRIEGFFVRSLDMECEGFVEDFDGLNEFLIIIKAIVLCSFIFYWAYM